MKNYRSLFALCLVLLFAIVTCAQTVDTDALEAKLNEIEGVDSAKLLGKPNNGLSVWLIMFEQPVDHNNPWKGTFTQRMFLTHRDFAAPMLMITDGYTVNVNYPYELTRMLGSNQLYIEHRYFGTSTPEVMDWQYLTTEQASNDYHHIRDSFGEFYPDKWISTGVSKGGQTALFYKYYYPQDVTATVAYVAPLALEQEDPRPWEHTRTVGPEECRKAVADFQKLVLEKRESMLKQLSDFATKYGIEFHLGIEPTLEIMVAEYPFSFWQYYKGNCDQVPGADATDEELFKHLARSVTPMYYTNKGYEAFKPAFYQFVTELGYYGFEVDHLGDLIKHKDKLDNRLFAPSDATIVFNKELNSKVNDFLINRAQNIVYIYGDYDTWTACKVVPGSATNSRIFISKGGPHSTQIRSFPPEQKKEIIALLEGWTGIEFNVEEEQK